VSGGAPMPAAVEEAVARRIAATIVQGYGMTETSGTISVNPPEAPRPGTCGRLFPLTQARVVDPGTGRDRPAGEAGEIWVRGPQLMHGYFGDEEATRTILTEDGWLRTGDLGLFDGDDYLHIVGRLKELIKVHAHQVAPAELEALLLTHSSIADAAVVGRPNQQTGEVPVAYVVTKAAIDPQELMSWVAARVAPYKKVRAVEFVQEIPRSSSGKILRHLLEAAQTHPLPRSRS
jgi:acyl-CoA synthetase (AMP-forming)/AMP-acid ligase II